MNRITQIIIYLPIKERQLNENKKNPMNCLYTHSEPGYNEGDGADTFLRSGFHMSMYMLIYIQYI